MQAAWQVKRNRLVADNPRSGGGLISAMQTTSAPVGHILATLVDAGYFGPGVGCQGETRRRRGGAVETMSRAAVPVRQWQVHDTWAARDLPVLDATIALLEQSFMVTVTDIAARTELTPSVVATALEALDPVYVDFRKTTTGGDPRYWYVFKVTPEARRAVGQWPTAEALASRLAEELAAAAREEPDAERQGLLAYAARLIGETLRDATVRAAGRVLRPAFGGLPVPELGMPVPEPQPVAEDDYPSLVDLPELPELLRTRAARARTTADPEPDEPTGGQPAVPQAQLLEPLPEPDEPTGGQPAVPQAQLLEPLPEPDEPTGGQPAVPQAQLLEPLPEPDESEAAAVAEAPHEDGAPPQQPDEVTAQ
jgi:hypothetical protein